MSSSRTRAIAAAAVVVVVAAGLGFALTGCGGKATTPSTRSVVSRPTKPESSVLKAAYVKYPRAPASQQTAPTASPRAGKTTTVFTLRLTVRHALGSRGYAAYDYRVYLVGPRPRCAEYTLVEAGRPGARVAADLRPPLELGWCIGTFHGTVLLETNPSCPPAPAGGRTRPCPAFAPRFADVGQFKFVTS